MGRFPARRNLEQRLQPEGVADTVEVSSLEEEHHHQISQEDYEKGSQEGEILISSLDVEQHHRQHQEELVQDHQQSEANPRTSPVCGPNSWW
jgi:hypothetical protein